MTKLNTPTRKIVRYTLGVMLSITLAYGINWDLAYIMPVFVAKIFIDKPSPTSHTVIELFASMIGTVLIALLVSNGITHYPFILLLLIGLLMFWAYYLFQNPEWNFFATLLIISTLLIPYLGISHPIAALSLGKGLMMSGVGAVVIFLAMHALLPEPSTSKDEQAVTGGRIKQQQVIQVNESIKALLISFPVIVYFYYFQIHGALLTMAFIGILSLQITRLKSIKLSVFLLLTNVTGGVLAVVAYELLVIVPWFPFLIALMTFIVLLFAQNLYSNPEKAALYASVLSAMLVLFGAAIASEGKEIDLNVYARIWQIILASVYMVLVACWLEYRAQQRSIRYC
ncbi:DUF2955 domain-containing protein [Photobacterium makurazakiensis]|uniref:DUF2955 domain-containing protein n=1 Tax=Photobacterium makurazakiensis TaxID=2910234 RepID=UPI003D0B54E4